MTLTLLAAVPLLALAGFRLWRIIAADSITEPIRAKIIYRDGPVWEWISTLILCSWCSGWWISGALSAGWIYATNTPWPWILILWPAVSGMLGIIATIMERITE